jgi:hypothetical protein
LQKVSFFNFTKVHLTYFPSFIPSINPYLFSLKIGHRTYFTILKTEKFSQWERGSFIHWSMKNDGEETVTLLGM